MKKDYERYNIAPGQVYVPADGSRNRLIVRDVLTYADAGDVVVYDEKQNCERRIDAFKLAMVRYVLDDCDVDAEGDVADHVPGG